MKSSGTWWKSAIFCAISLGFLVWIILPLDAFHDCIHQRKDYQRYQPLHKDGFSLVQLQLRLRLNAVCIVHLAVPFQGILIALSGVAVAGFTGTLWWATGKMGRIAADQRSDTLRQLDLMREDFISTHRPKLIIRGPQLMNASEDDLTRIHFEIVNIGASDATTHRSGVEASNVPRRPKRPYVIVGDEDFLGGEIISPGESTSHVYTCPVSRLALAAIQTRTLRNPPPDDIFVLRGIIAYNDGNGIMRRTGFWREYDFDARRFRPSDDPDYEYQD
jgi:hypothetical protein